MKPVSRQTTGAPNSLRLPHPARAVLSTVVTDTTHTLHSRPTRLGKYVRGPLQRVSAMDATFT